MKNDSQINKQENISTKPKDGRLLHRPSKAEF